MANVSLDRISKRFPDGTTAVDDISLEILDREFLVLVGPSGCGKSTTLRLIAGLETCTEGQIRIGDRNVNDVVPKDRDVAMVFQNYALYPHMSVYKNLSFGLTLRYGGGVVARGLRKIFHPRHAKELNRLRAGIDSQVRQTASRLGIEHLLNRRPHQLSGGERQRVALGRAIVRDPAAFLFDEPLSNLDAKLRQQMRVELKRLHQELKATMVYVTHDQVEAMTLGDRVAVMDKGKILQVGKPLEVYGQPDNVFVARFIGNVPMNLVSGHWIQKDDGIVFEGSDLPIQLKLGGEQSSLVSRMQAGDDDGCRKVIWGFRAEDAALDNENWNIEGRILAVDQLGESSLVHLKTEQQENVEQTWGDTTLAIKLPASSYSPGDRLKLKIDQGKSMWFDPDSGQNLLKEKS